jgi:flagellin-like protein
LKALRKEGRRGVSPVIATLLLIVIAVAAAVLVYMWTVGYATQMRPTTPETGERLKIEAGVLDSSSGQATLYVRNVGGSPARVKTAYLLTTSQDVIERKDGIDVDIDVGSVQSISISFTSTNVKKDQTYIVRIVTSLGNEFAIELKAR